MEFHLLFVFSPLYSHINALKYLGYESMKTNNNITVELSLFVGINGLHLPSHLCPQERIRN